MLTHFYFYYIGVPHGTTEDTIIKLKCSGNDNDEMETKDFLIPKSSMVVSFHWHMNRNKDLWGSDAIEFRPERFLNYEDLDGSYGMEPSLTHPTLTIPPHFMPFQVFYFHRKVIYFPFFYFREFGMF